MAEASPADWVRFIAARPPIIAAFGIQFEATPAISVARHQLSFSDHEHHDDKKDIIKQFAG